MSLCLLRDLPQGKPRLVRAEGRRLACVRRGDRVDVLEDRCPHEGHPLSMGVLRDGVLTCPWHNWKFDVGTGSCLFGGESARHYTVEIVDEEVFVDLALDAEEARRRLEEDLLRAISDGAVDGAVREALRLAKTGGDPFVPFVRAALLRTPYGAGDAILAIDAALSLEEAGVIDRAEAIAVAASAVADETRGRAEAPLPEAIASTLGDRDLFLDDLLEERRHDAVARALGLPAETSTAEITNAWLLPFSSIKLWDRGLTLARVRATEVLAERFGEQVRAEALVGITTSLGWAVAESDLPAWRATRTGLLEAARIEPGAGPLPEAYGAAIRRGERDAVAATVSAARDGADPRGLVEALASVALERAASYDVACSTRPGSAVTAFEPARAVLFADAALRADHARTRFVIAQAVMLAGLVGRVRRYAGALARPRPDLRGALRQAALSPRCVWASRGRTASFAAACMRLGSPELAAAALERATQEDVGGGLARVAATARHVVEGRDVDD